MQPTPPEVRAAPHGAGQAVIDVDPRRLDTERGQPFALRCEILFLGGHPGVPDQQSRHDEPPVG